VTAIVDSTMDVPVRKSIVVKAGMEDAFRIFTEDFDSWWPRSHHIGKSPMQRAIVECRNGGRCYTVQDDGTDCDWGTVLAWEPPRRLVFAWQITHQWGYEPDLAKSSEVEVRFTPGADGTTRVDLEHRYFHRHGAGGAAMRTAVDSPNGWGDLLALFGARVERGG
jgi:uncharacterized protein YndB with AHSA1/START domain